MKNIGLKSYCYLLLTLQMQIVTAEINGEQVYVRNCMVCHADDGTGAMPGVADLTKNRKWLSLTEAQLLARLIEGIQTPGVSVTMPPRGGNPNLKDDDLRAVLFYMRNTFNKQ